MEWQVSNAFKRVTVKSLFKKGNKSKDQFRWLPKSITFDDRLSQKQTTTGTNR